MRCSNCGNYENCFFSGSDFCPGWKPEEVEQPDEKKIEQTGEDGLFELIGVPFQVI